MLNEIWRDIKHYEGKYMISNYGRVKSLISNKYISVHINNYGYLFVKLYAKNGKRRQEYIHRLVAMTFLENPDNLPEVNHKDEDRQNNYVDNLEWCTHEYNQNYGNHNKRISDSSKGLKRHNKKCIRLSDKKIFDCIKDTLEEEMVSYETMKKRCKNRNGFMYLKDYQAENA